MIRWFSLIASIALAGCNGCGGRIAPDDAGTDAGLCATIADASAYCTGDFWTCGRCPLGAWCTTKPAGCSVCVCLLPLVEGGPPTEDCSFKRCPMVDAWP